MTRKKMYSILLVPFIWLTLTSAVAAQQSEKTKPQQSGSFVVKLAKGNLSIDASEAPLTKVFEEIAKQAAIVIESGIGPEEKITIKFDGVPMEDALKRLSKNVTIFYARDAKDKSPRIARVVVLSEGKNVAERL